MGAGEAEPSAANAAMFTPTLLTMFRAAALGGSYDAVQLPAPHDANLGGSFL